MNEELARLKADVESIRSIAGLGEPLTHDDLRVNVMTAAAGALALVWTLLPHQRAEVWGLLAVLAPFAYLLYLGWKYRASAGAPPVTRREYWQDLKILWLAIPYIGYWFWAKQLGIEPIQILGTAVFFVAIQMLFGGITDPRFRHGICWGLALAIGALLLPIASLSPVTVLALVILLGGGTASFIIYLQLRRVRLPL